MTLTFLNQLSTKTVVIFFRVVFHLGIGLDGPIGPVSLDDLKDPIGLVI